MKNQSTELTEIRRIDKIKNKFTGLIERVGKRNLIIAGAVLLIGVAVALNFALFTGSKEGGYDYDQPSGNITDNGSNNTTDTSAEYFAATQVSRQSTPAQRSMVLKIVDEELLQKTGGIVQGMSGSPIIQDGRLIGAVTHVFVNDPAMGYGLYIEWMLRESAEH